MLTHIASFQRFAGLILFTLLLAGCASPDSYPRTEPRPKPGPVMGSEPIRLREGDVVRIEFPGAPSLNAREQIKRDGRIALLVGEVTAAGKTLAELQQELLELYSDQLVTKVVTVHLESSSYPVYVTGAVLRPGRITADRPMTALEAVMEAGVNHSRANLKGVRVTRTHANGETDHFVLNLDQILRGRDSQPFYLDPSDIVFVPEKFQWW